jgi:hypothetical protein
MIIIQENKEFVDSLFDKLFKHVDTDMLDLHDSDSCDDHLQFEQLNILDGCN